MFKHTILVISSTAILKDSIPVQYQECYQCCPNLSLEGVLAGTNEGTDMKILFDLAEELLNIPSGTVNIGYSCCSELEKVGQKNNRFICFLVESNYPGVIVAAAGYAYNLITQYDVLDTVGYILVLNHLIQGVTAHSCDIFDSAICEFIVKSVLVVPSVDHRLAILSAA